MRYAETWDYHVTPSTFLQFDIAMGCSGTYSTLYGVMLEYSTNRGRSWSPVSEECLPPQMDCSGYHLSSMFMSDAHANWTRVTVYLPAGAISPATRFRWLQDKVTLRGNVWALDNIYLGNGCPWMCSGHGYCVNGDCVCDKGYFGPFCVPSVQLPMGMSDTFNKPLRRDTWPELYGGESTNICGIIVSGASLTFYKEGLRLVSTQDLDVSMSTYVQFTFHYGCHYPELGWPRERAVLLQYSNNGGILWSLLKELHYVDYSKPRFYNIPLPGASQTNATRFRFWQPQSEGHMKSVWSVDNLYIGGSVMNPSQLYDTFDDEPSLDQWLFWPGGKIGTFCSYNTRSDTLVAGSSAIVFNRGPGEHSLTTIDVDVNDMSVIQFDLNVGCSSQTSGAFPVHLQYSLDSGRSWQHIVPPCSQDTIPTCEEQRTEATVYYAGATPYWRRITVPLHGTDICGTARFRWYQGVFSTKELAPEWAVDNVYVGMACQGHCGGHGVCIQGMMCMCDDGYGGHSCRATSTRHTFLKEGFESDIPLPLDPSKWWLSSGGDASHKCGILLEGNSMYFHENGARELQTNDIDLSVAQIIQFFIRLGCGKPGSPIPPDTEPILLQYSNDAGIHWHTIETISFKSEVGSGEYAAIQLPERARTNTTRIRWWQPTIDGTFKAQWAIDQIYIGGDINGRMVLTHDLPPLTSDMWLMAPGSSVQQTCGLKVDALHFDAPAGVRYAITADLAVTVATYLQFYIAVGCSPHGKCYSVTLEYSVDFGKTWQMVSEECMPSDVKCTSYHSQSVFTSDVYNGWHRVTLPLPFYTRSKSTRFRWVQYADYAMDDTWSLTHVYIGDECNAACAGHGRCHNGACLCDEGWQGNSCSQPLENLPTLLSDSFTLPPGKNNWAGINGGFLSDKCGVLAAGPALHFTGPCSRQLITKDLDLTEGQFVQFYVRFGCISPPTSRDEGIIVDYSPNGGITWTKTTELFYDMYKEVKFEMIEIPKVAKRNGVRIRFWQPHHPGVDQSDWAIDNVFIGGKDPNPNEVVEQFADGPWIDKWIEVDNGELKEFCNRKSTIIGEATSKEHVKLTTTDVAIKDNYILEFSISVGCDVDWNADISPVHLEYSTDLGMTWHHVVKPCLPFYKECNGQASIPTIYYAHKGWRRETIPLDGPIKSRATRFRWLQVRDPSMSSSGDHHWALDHVYIGPACEAACHGHGVCDHPHCRCDKGYAGHACQTRVDKHTTYLKDSFRKEGVIGVDWGLVQGGTVTDGCMELVHGHALHFSGHGQRQVITTDLDLRNARFIQYIAMIGGPSSSTSCSIPRSRNDSVLLQYSTDGGISWHRLHLLDHTDYWLAPQYDYISLPLSARTASTQIRWWQMIGPHHTNSQSDPLIQNDDPSPWTLEDVYIGGSEINPSVLHEDFEEVLDETVWEFYPNAAKWNNVCSRRSSALTWDESPGIKKITTGQLIIQEGYMIQFKIVVGCGSPVFLCNQHQSVVLQYNKDPATDDWEQVYPRCLLNGHETNMECRPYRFHQGTVYTANEHSVWTRISLELPPKVYSSVTRFRWLQEGAARTDSSPMWALDDIYIGETCPQLCSGRGDCVHGRCACDLGYFGETCEPMRGRLLSHMTDGFEAGISAALWASVEGGGLGLGCGSLHPLAHGKTLYFNGCGLRQAVTTEMDVHKASKVMFVLQIGSHKQTPTCNVNLAQGSTDGTILLQFTKDKGISWQLLATHDPQESLTARRVGYEIPPEARTHGVQFRWWQPQHRGTGYDQWALDQVEIIMSRHDQMLHKQNRMSSFRTEVG